MDQVRKLWAERALARILHEDIIVRIDPRDLIELRLINSPPVTFFLSSLTLRLFALALELQYVALM